MASLTAILIDPAAQTVTHVESTGEMPDLYKLIDTDFIEALRIDPGHTLLVAEEPNSDTMPFGFGRTAIRGRALVVAIVGEEMVSATMTLDEVRALVTFH